MDAIWPSPARDVDPLTAYAADERRPPGGRPWVMVNMIASADGSVVDSDGRSGGLAGPGDRAVFSAIRAVADVIVAGSSTVVAEDYGPARPPPAVRRMRRARGQADVPRIAVVSGSLTIRPDRRLFREAPAGARPIVLTIERADPARRRALAEVAEVRDAGVHLVDWRLALAVLADATGAGAVLCEGGPTTVAQLVADDLVDELCLTIAPTMVVGTGPRVAQGPHVVTSRELALDRVLVEDGYLFLRYLRAGRGG
ncbi:MAG TPA: dihydrofolate reductase family protein [Acidimicrobiales bacterium]